MGALGGAEESRSPSMLAGAAPPSVASPARRPAARPDARAPHTRPQDCQPFLKNPPALDGMWLVTLLLLYSLQEGKNRAGAKTSGHMCVWGAL